MSAPGSARPRRWRGMEPEERDAHRRRRLLDAAVALFGTEGYARTTVTALCTEARVATRSFYELFGRREALLLAVYNEIVDELAVGMVTALQSESTDVRARVRAGVATAVGPLLADERKGRIVELEVVGVDEAIERRRREVVRAFAGVLDQELKRMVKLELIAPFETGLVTLVMVGGVTEALIDHLLTPRRRRRPREELVDELTRVWLRVLAVSETAAPGSQTRDQRHEGVDQ